MKLDCVDIKNFRSIQYVRVNFNPTCRVFVGINESGKSNILNALSLMGEDSVPVAKFDLREALQDESPIDDSESYVRFVFKFDKSESDALLDAVTEGVLASSKNPEIISIAGKKKSVKEFCATRSEGLYNINIPKESKTFQYWELLQSYKLLPGWKKPASACPKDFKIDVKGQSFQLSLYKLIRAADFPDIPAEYLEDATIDDLEKLSGSAITTITKENLPDTLFWEYSEENLLPDSIKIADFSAKPDMCVPLKNMFLLAGIDDIKTSIESARKGTDNQFQNYLNRIAKKTTNHFRDVWKEYKGIKFALRLNGDHIVPGVEEKNIHDFARRSDGFKRFVTFLLMVSLNVKTGNLSDTLLLIDEPDISLHPSGARYLRDELIRISKSNYVAYSTHSIFMIDSGDIGRHLIVKKKDEITTIETAGAANVADEEVLYNALGYSVFGILKEKNIIFEGWNDKKLFRVAIEDASATLKKKFKDFGVCHAKGVKNIKAITPMIELAKRSCVVISDSDAPAKEQQKTYRQEAGFGTWMTYQDIDSTINAVTGEDFVKNDFIAKQVKRILASASMPAFDQTILSADKGKLAAISGWLSKNGMTTDQAGDTIKKIKNLIFEDLKHHDIEAAYFKLLESIKV